REPAAGGTGFGNRHPGEGDDGRGPAPSRTRPGQAGRLRGLRPGQLVRPLGAIVTLAPASVLLLLLGAFALACLTPLAPGDPPGDIARTLRDPLAWAGVAGAGAAGIVPAVIAAGLVTSPDRCLPRSRVMARFARTFAGVVAAVAVLPAA